MQVCDDSGSETCSESMLPMMEEEEERSSSPIFSSRPEYQGMSFNNFLFLFLYYSLCFHVLPMVL